MCWALKPQKECNMGIVIVGGGRLDRSALAFFKEEQVVIGVDGGLKFCYENHIPVNYAVGDFDTIEPEILAYYKKEGKAEIRAYEPEKDWTDSKVALELAVQLIKQQCKGQENTEKSKTAAMEILLLGGIGTRMDHTLANIGCLTYALEQQVPLKIIDSYNCMYAYDHSFTICREQLIYKKYLSLMAMGTKVNNLTIRGMKYQVENITLPLLSDWGVSNELLEEKAEITFSDGILLVIESRD